MLTTMTEEDWTIVLKVFEASRSRRGDKGRNDRKFLEALQYFVVHNPLGGLSRKSLGIGTASGSGSGA
jgi:hypothetical protein